MSGENPLAEYIVGKYHGMVHWPPFAFERLDMATNQVMAMHQWEATPQNRINALEVLYATKAIDNILSPADREIYANPTDFLEKAPADGVKAYLLSMEAHLPNITPEEAEDNFIRNAPMEQVQKYLTEQEKR
jgi:hypothetical protein